MSKHIVKTEKRMEALLIDDAASKELKQELISLRI